jgi:hypothetical protein
MVMDLIEACKVKGDPQTIFSAIEEDRRARMATPVLAYTESSKATTMSFEGPSKKPFAKKKRKRPRRRGK